MEEGLSSRVDEAVKYLRGRLPQRIWQPSGPMLGIICGSGLGGLAEAMGLDFEPGVPYADIPHFSQSTGRIFLFFDRLILQS